MTKRYGYECEMDSRQVYEEGWPDDRCIKWSYPNYRFMNVGGQTTGV